MRNLLPLMLLLISFTIFAQIPPGINYQSIAYDSSNSPILNNNVGIKISILNLSSTGSVVYSEKHTVLTNSQGLYNLVIGQGTVLSGTFSAIPWSVGTKFLKVELDPTGGTNYIASGTSQFMSVPYAFSSGATTDGIIAIKNIATLRLVVGNSEGDVAYVKDYAGNNDGGGGHFTWRIEGYTNSTDNGGTIIAPTLPNPSQGKWVRNIEGTSINVKWFGILGDANVGDYSQKLIELINTFNTDMRGIKVIFPKGIYRLKDIVIPTGFTFYAEQGVSHNLSYTTPVIIRPASGAEYIFKFLNTTKNASLENLSIDGDFQNVTTLKAAVLFNGEANRLYNNNIVYCYRHAVIGSPFISRIENNMIQGLFGGSNIAYGNDDSIDMGYIGALHLTSCGDTWIMNNEIGVSNKYGQLISLDRKAVAFFGDKITNSLISGNIFENGDKGAYIMFSVQNRFSSNRYEFNGSNGLELVNNSQSVFTGEFFTGNSLSQNNTYDDLTIGKSGNAETNQSSTLTFVNPIFVAGDNGGLTAIGIDPSTRLPRYNVTNYGQNTGDWKVIFITPYFSPSSRANSNPSFNSNLPARLPYVLQ